MCPRKVAPGVQTNLLPREAQEQTLALGTPHTPPPAQSLWHFRAHRLAILAFLAPLDPKGHALAVAVASFQRATPLARSLGP